MKIASLRKQALAAPKFLLATVVNGEFMYVAEEQTLFSCNLTNKESEACKFSVGFDNPKMKIWGWNNSAKQNKLNIQFFDLLEADIINAN